MSTKGCPRPDGPPCMYDKLVCTYSLTSYRHRATSECSPRRPRRNRRRGCRRRRRHLSPGGEDAAEEPLAHGRHRVSVGPRGGGGEELAERGDGVVLSHVLHLRVGLLAVSLALGRRRRRGHRGQSVVGVADDVCGKECGSV